jgi:hypothetical protein
MKEIKFLLYSLYVAFYTSLIWATVIWDGIPVGPNDFPIGLLGALGTTAANIFLIVFYLKEHW